MYCPVCKTVGLVMTERQGIEIDYCPQCRGVWLDRGELDKIIERSMSVSPAPMVERHAPPHASQHHSGHDRRDSHSHHDSHDREHYKKHKREGLLANLFDFD
ncbi:MAG TPA: zf-TFIIB domain-containing protein [Gallionella sp.]|nr:zf-TFIIB domain-containing protein [Gallionella sp.]